LAGLNAGGWGTEQTGRNEAVRGKVRRGVQKKRKEGPGETVTFCSRMLRGRGTRTISKGYCQWASHTKKSKHQQGGTAHTGVGGCDWEERGHNGDGMFVAPESAAGN